MKGALATLQHRVGREREEEQEEIERTRQEIRDKVKRMSVSLHVQCMHTHDEKSLGIF